MHIPAPPDAKRSIDSRSRSRSTMKFRWSVTNMLFSAIEFRRIGSPFTMAQTFERLAGRGLLVMDDPMIAASHFNWLLMSEPLNRAMLLGDKAIPKPTALRRYAAEGARVPCSVR